MSVWTNFVKKWASENNCSYGSAMANKQCGEDYRKEKPSKQEGDGFMSDMSRKVGQAIIGKKATRQVESYGHAVINGRNDYPPKVRDLINKYGNEIIVSAMIRRAPVQSVISSALNVVSMGQFNKNMEKEPYDNIFHLQFYFTTQSAKKFVVEKNEVINMELYPSTPAKTETIVINPLTQGLTIHQLMDNTKNIMGASMFGYSAKDNNCQDFVMGILNGNHIGNEADRSFVKQNTDKLFSGTPNNYLRKLSNTMTDLGAKANIITTGAGIKKASRKIKRLNA